ncbi:antimicrobial peptide NK-lysin-like [Trichomycterus rosablanca]|uniref:antimicrobial peptide NK-lysin-like n=1 Tax=Trichomycterus rosablanca TaxID=2290929 RepID=UPI002F356305
MFRNLLIASFLMGTVCAIHLEYLSIDSAEEVLDESLGTVDEAEDLPMPSAQLPGVCWACKWAMNKLKNRISKGASVDEIKSQLLEVCNQIGFLKGICRKIIHKYLDVLIEELSTSDDPKNICINVGICKSVVMMKFIQDFPQTLKNL